MCMSKQIEQRKQEIKRERERNENNKTVNANKLLFILTFYSEEEKVKINKQKTTKKYNIML